MQNVDSDYRTAIRSHDRPYDEVYGVVTFSDGTTLNLTPSIIPTNSIELERQCISGEELEFGGVFLDTLSMNILNDNYSRYAFYEASVTLNYRIRVNGAWKRVRLGKFTIAEADRPNKNTISFTAYDDMRKLDKSLQTTVLQGTPWDILHLISELVDYPLSFEEPDLHDFPNYTFPILIDESSGIKTYRDAVKVVCQQLGCFARDNRKGEMELVKFHTEPDSILSTSVWYSIKIADYECTYISVTATGEKGTFTAVDEETELGNAMIIGDAPAWDYGAEAILQSKVNNLLTYLQTIPYTPVQIEMPSDASFDCGDRLSIITPNGDTVETLITSYVWKWRAGMTIYSKGVNPYLQGASTSDITNTRLMNKQTQESMLTYYTYINANDITLTTEPQTILKIKFSVVGDTTLTVWHEMKTLNTLSGSTQTIYYDWYYDTDLMSYAPVDTFGEDGYHTQPHPHWFLNVEAGATHTWEVKARVDSGTAICLAGELNALMMGQRMSAMGSGDRDREIQEEYKISTLPIIPGQPLANLVDDPDPELSTEQGGLTLYLTTENGDSVMAETGIDPIILE
jgi:hypothetical protein